jgi:hypothetical protein
MRTATLTRTETSDSGSFGKFKTDSGLSWCSGELPWRDNAPDRSCVPCGTYLCVWGASPRLGKCYHVQDVPGRTDIEIHSANFMGDRSLGLHCDLLGCIALGQQVGDLEGQQALLMSRVALDAMQAEFNQESFQLTILDSSSGENP